MVHPEQSNDDNLMLDLRKYILVMAILAATVTYVAGLNPPGGVWLSSKDGYLIGNQILVVTDHPRYNAFFYSNGAAFMASVVVILLLLLVEQRENAEKGSSPRFIDKAITTRWWQNPKPLILLALRVVMALDMLALMVAYAAGASRGMVTTVFSSVLVSVVSIYAVFHMIKYIGAGKLEENAEASGEDKKLERARQIMMLFAIFAATITYTAGMSPPGGFWPDTQDSHRAGDPVLLDDHSRRFVAFFVCNTFAFITSLAAIMLLTTVTSKLEEGSYKKWCHHAPYVCVNVALLGLFVAYAIGSCRKTRSTVYLFSLVLPVLIYTVLQFMIQKFLEQIKRLLASCLIENNLRSCWGRNDNDHEKDNRLKKAHSLVLLLATLATTITYQAGMNPPGGFWPDNRDGHKGGDPVLVTTHARRYRVFFYCNSVALVTSVVVIVMVLSKHVTSSVVHKRHALEAAMILDLLSLMAAYAVGCCRDVTTSLHVIALAGAVLVYVVIHIVFFTLDPKVRPEEEMNKKRKLLLLLAILAATITYQAGLTPPGGFWGEDDGFGHRAGYPVLLSNYPRRYTTFFYCNATSFMASIAMIILLVNPNLYTPGINCYALYVCALAGLFGLVGAYVAGSSRHVRTSIIVVALVAVVFVFVILLLIVLKQNKDPKPTKSQVDEKGTEEKNIQEDGKGTEEKMIQEVEKGTEEKNIQEDEEGTEEKKIQEVEEGTEEKKIQEDEEGTEEKKIQEDEEGTEENKIQEVEKGTEEKKTQEEKKRTIKEKKEYTKGKYLMLVGILVASVTYQAGLTPPGGVWPDSSNGHTAGDSVLHDSNKHRYRFFFYSNSISFLASAIVILLLLLDKPLFSEKGLLRMKSKELLRVAQSSVVLALLGLLWAYASGCSREWETFGYIGALAFAVLLYIAIHVVLSCRDKKDESPAKQCNCKCICKAGGGALEGTKVGANNV
ncbi:uncharacterized protein LOC119328405 [Triticum dicoccoides]|uniref:uncharacterized protein LOC119328405 n=1 Tax=Triticum dicoccoides TaxID=85692 RepID=UPI001890BD32|nr:uncharacterized protein LOC119328405 [Triticum dicoccoides]